MVVIILVTMVGGTVIAGLSIVILGRGSLESMKGNVRIAGLAALLSAGILFIAPQDAAAGVLPQGFW